MSSRIRTDRLYEGLEISLSALSLSVTALIRTRFLIFSWVLPVKKHEIYEIVGDIYTEGSLRGHVR